MNLPTPEHAETESNRILGLARQTIGSEVGGVITAIVGPTKCECGKCPSVYTSNYSNFHKLTGEDKIDALQSIVDALFAATINLARTHTVDLSAKAILELFLDTLTKAYEEDPS